MQNNKRTGLAGWMRDKGYYIVLVLCVAAVGISGYLYFSQSTAPEGEAAAAAAMQQETATAQEDVTDVTQPDSGQATLVLQPPLQGEVIETFATDHLAYNDTTQDWRVHNGIDLAADTGTEVCAAADGVVSAVYEDDLMGHIVEITHDHDYVTRYCNLASDIPVQAGDQVLRGAVIGSVGSSAKLEVAQQPHLHFEVFCGETQLNPETCFEN